MRHCQSFKQSKVVHALCPAPTMASLREAASHVRMSCRLVWVSPSFIPQWATRVAAFSTAHTPLSQLLSYQLRIPALVRNNNVILAFLVLLAAFHIACIFCCFLMLCFMIKSKGQRKGKWEAALRCWLPVAMAMGFCRLQDSCYF